MGHDACDDPVSGTWNFLCPANLRSSPLHTSMKYFRNGKLVLGDRRVHLTVKCDNLSHRSHITVPQWMVKLWKKK